MQSRHHVCRTQNIGWSTHFRSRPSSSDHPFVSSSFLFCPPPRQVKHGLVNCFHIVCCWPAASRLVPLAAARAASESEQPHCFLGLLFSYEVYHIEPSVSQSTHRSTCSKHFSQHVLQHVAVSGQRPRPGSCRDEESRNIPQERSSTQGELRNLVLEPQRATFILCLRKSEKRGEDVIQLSFR